MSKKSMPISKTPEQIASMEANFQNFPPSITTKPRWIHWRRDAQDDGTYLKRPYQAYLDEGMPRLAKINDPTTWVTYEEALAALDWNVMDGIGYALDAAAGETLTDQDDVINEQGTIRPEAQNIIHALKSYTEYSQGGGTHTLCITKDPPPTLKGAIEIYHKDRFVFMTGNLYYHPDSYPYRNLETRTYELKDLYQSYAPPQPTISDHKPTISTYGEHNLTAEQIIQLGMQEKDGRFAALFNLDRDWIVNHESKLLGSDGDLDLSDIDYELVTKIMFYAGDNQEIILDVLKQSPIWNGNDKRPRKYVRTDYLPNTIQDHLNKGLPSSHYQGGQTNPIFEKMNQLKSLQMKRAYAEETETEPLTDAEGYALTTYSDPVTNDKSKPPLFLRWSDICEEMKKATKWCVEGLIEAGSFCLVNGDSYAGKSLAIAPIVKAVLLGECIGDFQAYKMPVAIVDFENSIRHFGKTLGVLLDTPEEREEIQKNLYRYNRIGRQAEGCDMGATPEQKLAIIIDLIESINKEHGTNEGMMIIDTMRGVFGLDSRDEEKAINTMYPLRGIADRYGWTIMALHHNQKHKQQYSGSMAMIGATTHQFSVEKDTTKRETYFKLEESRDGAHESLIFSYEDNIPLSDYFPPETYPAIRNDKWHRLIYKSTSDQASVNAAADQAQQDCVHICKYLQQNEQNNKQEIQTAMSEIQFISINKKSKKISKARSQAALIWGVANGWIEQDMADKNNAFLYTLTKLGSAQTTAAGIQKLRF